MSFIWWQRWLLRGDLPPKLYVFMREDGENDEALTTPSSVIVEAAPNPETIGG